MSFLEFGIEAIEGAAAAAEEAGAVTEDAAVGAEKALKEGDKPNLIERMLNNQSGQQIDFPTTITAPKVGVQTAGFAEARAMLQGIADGMRNPEAALAPELETLEAAERERFAALGGREVDTGRLERSLTESGGPDAIREVTSSELVFGTRVPYAQYQTDEDGNNLVMVRPGDAGQAGIAQRVLDRVVNG